MSIVTDAQETDAARAPDRPRTTALAEPRPSRARVGGRRAGRAPTVDARPTRAGARHHGSMRDLNAYYGDNARGQGRRPRLRAPTR